MAFNLTGYKIINGTSRADKLVGTVGQDALFGDLGDDKLYGGAANDILDGGAGADTMYGGTGGDIYVVDSASDKVVELANEGTDTIHASVSLKLAANVENLILTGTGDLNGTGNTLNNVITGNAGNNALAGGDGNDTLNGGSGLDALNGGNGNDRLYGDAGVDTLTGGAGNDTLNGGADNDTARGGSGIDGLFGGGGNDLLFGDAGNDAIYGDGGDDRISGGQGSDILTGGQMANGFSAGNDTFAWVATDVVKSGVNQGFDHITDFGFGDRLDFTAMNLGTAPIASLVHVRDTAAGSMVSVDFPGATGFVDVVILDGVHTTLDALLSDGAIAV